MNNLFQEKYDHIVVDDKNSRIIEEFETAIWRQICPRKKIFLHSEKNFFFFTKFDIIVLPFCL